MVANGRYSARLCEEGALYTLMAKAFFPAAKMGFLAERNKR